MTLRFRKRYTFSRFSFVFAVITFFILIIVGLIFFTLSSPVPSIPLNALYRDPQMTITDRVSDLMSYMTLEEKIGQMALVEKNSIKKNRDIRTYGLGGMLSGFGGKPEDNTPLGWKEMVTTFDSESRASRLGIPVLYGVDANHGHSNVPGATVFPHFIGLGASGDASLVRNVAKATANELLVTGIRWSYSPTYDMPEDIRWGRTYETFSDDPQLVSELGKAHLLGLQEAPVDVSSSVFVMATPKHYVGAGGMMWDTSINENFKIDQGWTAADETKLRTRYLPPFQEAVNAGATSIMVGLNSWNGTKLAASSYLIQTVLKDELGFNGFVVSDWYGVYEIPGSDYEAAVIAINAGVDMVMLPFDYKDFVRNVKRAVRSGEISEARIDDAVERILTAKFKLGLFDEVPSMDMNLLGSKEHRALARDAVARSLVLLKNDGGVLPLHKEISLIRIAGSAADNIGRQSGAWTVEWQGIDGNWLPGATSIRAGIQEAVGDDSLIQFNANADFPKSTQKADVGIAVVGETPYAEGWGDAELPSLRAEDIAVIERLKETCEKIVVVLVTGRPLIITDDIPRWDAVVVAWLPGSEGAGVADVLFGTKPFTGKLPLPWPATISQVPIVGESTQDGTYPLFPRYFGLR